MYTGSQGLGFFPPHFLPQWCFGAAVSPTGSWSEVEFEIHSEMWSFFCCSIWLLRQTRLAFNSCFSCFCLLREGLQVCVSCCLALVVWFPSDSPFYLCWLLVHKPVNEHISGSLREAKEDSKQGGSETSTSLYSSSTCRK